MVLAHNRNPQDKREQRLQDETQMPALDAVLDHLYIKYGFPVARLAAGKKSLSKPYIQKLESLLLLDPESVKKAITHLDTAAKALESRQHGKGGVQVLLPMFDAILENELVQLRDIQSDRDLSILQLIGMDAPAGEEIGERGEVSAKKKRLGRLGHEGRIDDPLIEYSSPTPSVGWVSPRGRRKLTSPVLYESILPLPGLPTVSSEFDPEVPIPSSASCRQWLQGTRGLQYYNDTVTVEETATDDDSDQSFYSCPGTPQSEPAEQRIEPENANLLSNPLDQLQPIHQPRHTAYSTANSRPDSITAYRHSSPLANNGKRPSLSRSYPKSDAIAHRKFHSPAFKQRGDFEEKKQTSFGTNTTYSAESSFNSTSFPNEPEKDWSPLTSADSSFNDDPISTTHAARKKSHWPPIISKGFGCTRSPEGTRALSTDWDGDLTDNDDLETNYEVGQSRVLAQIFLPTSKRQFPRFDKKESCDPLELSRRNTPEAPRFAEEDEEELQKLAHEFGGEELGRTCSSNLQMLLPKVISVGKKNKDQNANLKAIVSHGATGEAIDTTLREIEAVSPVGEWCGINSPEHADTEERWDDEDEFGTIDTSFEKELSDIPALKPTSHPLSTLHFSIQYEATRIALNMGFQSNDLICTHLNGYCDELYEAREYHEIWNILTNFSPATVHLERTNESVWRNFKEGRGWPDNVYLSGRVHYNETQPGPIPPLIITLNPLARKMGNRFLNRFGADRFLTLRLPQLTGQKGLSEDVVQQRRGHIIDWLADEEIYIMNRTWKCFYIKEPEQKKKKSAQGKTLITEYFHHAVFFATKGVGIGDNLDDGKIEALGFRKTERKLRHEMSVEELLKWHIPFKGNLNMTVPKFWSRISLGFSSSTPTVAFEPSQIQFVDDIVSWTGEVMNDGCSVASPAVMNMIRERLGLMETPTAVQARLGGAKGVWMIDPMVDLNSTEVYIKVAASQLKYKGHDNDNDWARLTLDVLTTSHDPVPTAINIQLIPILTDRGVPFEVLQQLLEEHLQADLQELFDIIDEPLELRRWIYDRGNVGMGRVAEKAIPTLGGLPQSRQEIAIMLLEGGFLARECYFLMLQVRKMIDQYCDDLKTKLHIKIPNSTSLLCVADPTESLHEGEVSLRFSKGVLDHISMRRNSVITGDILVARNPAHLPSDIQRVKAVDIQSYHNPRLRELKDVIVFSVKGDRSLASLLSGGDYDGDKPWVCWDRRVVERFQNSSSTFSEEEKQVRQYFTRSETTMTDLQPDEPGFFNRFLRAGISNSLQDNFLGLCTSIWESYSYKKNSISDPKSIELAKLCSMLVDAPKQGMTLLPTKRQEITRFGKAYPKPAYKDLANQSDGTHVIDRLHFDVAEQKVTEKQQAFHENFGKFTTHDHPITETFRRETELAAKEGPGKPLDLTLKHLKKELTALFEDWCSWNALRDSAGADEFRSGIPRFHNRFREIKPPEGFSQDPVISRWLLDADSPSSQWSILRASAAYYRWNHNRGLVWYMAGRELCYIKSREVELRKPGFVPRTIIGEMYLPLKTGAKFRGVKRAVAVEEVGDETEEYSI